ncbi:hypothetical protein [Maribacter sp.]|uniref:hypothetical protein n=1 Tax=Maribacter sp. TaxID=1897614 RepID=UPI0025B922D7|nr:hypothetical protein [Maribacter sp.]
MVVIKEIKLIADTQKGDEEVVVKMGINCGTSQPIYHFNFRGCYFDRGSGNIFKDHEKNVYVKIKDIKPFEKAIKDLINIIRNEPVFFNQEEFDNL